jgi:hypothetical protein
MKKRKRKMITVHIPARLHSDIVKLANSNGMKFNTLFKRLVVNAVKKNLSLIDSPVIRGVDIEKKQVNIDYIKEWQDIKEKAKKFDMTGRDLLILILEEELKKDHIVDSITYK